MWYRRLIAGFAVGVGVAGCGSGGVDPRVDDLPDRAIWFNPQAGCADTSARWLPATRVSDTLSSADATRRSDERWAWWARRVPGGWAGGPYYLGSPGPAAIFLRDPSQKVAALAALDTLLPPDPFGRVVQPDRIEARSARWDLAELYDWMVFVTSNFHTARGTGINGWGISTQKNRLTLMIENAGTFPAVTSWLQGLNIPCRLVAVEVVGPISLASDGPSNDVR